MSSPVQFLQQLKSLIDTPEKWTKHKFARDAAGEETDMFSRAAVCFCLEGAYSKAADVLWPIDGTTSTLVAGALRESIAELYPENRYSGTVAFNDDPKTKHEDVVRVIDHTIRKLSPAG
jgi:hypothetical protein